MFDDLHFNWGYHDGANDAARDGVNRWATEDHYSSDYKAGYLYGFNDRLAGRYNGDSGDARTEAINFGDIQA